MKIKDKAVKHMSSNFNSVGSASPLPPYQLSDRDGAASSSSEKATKVSVATQKRRNARKQPKVQS